MVEDRIRGGLGELSLRLGVSDWLDGAFSAQGSTSPGEP